MLNHLKDMGKFKYSATALTNYNCIHRKIKSTLNSSKVGYHFIQNLSSSHLRVLSEIQILDYVTFCFI
jgi:hypothetical protein